MISFLPLVTLSPRLLSRTSDNKLNISLLIVLVAI